MSMTSSADDTSLPALLDPISVDEFLRSWLGCRIVHHRGPAERYTLLFGWDVVNDILSLERFDSARVMVVRNSELMPFPLFTEAVPLLTQNSRARRVVPGTVARLLREGFSLVLSGVEELHRPLRAWTEELEGVVHVPVQVNAYVSAGLDRGFRVHWDDHDVFILQIAGRKRWEIFGPTIDAPIHGVLEPSPPDEGTDALMTTELEPGDFMHVPRGWWHAVTSIGEPTVHLTVGMRHPTALDALRTVLEDAARESALLRRDIPRSGNDASEHEWAMDIARAITELLADPFRLVSAARAAIGSPVRRPVASLPGAIQSASPP